MNETISLTTLRNANKGHVETAPQENKPMKKLKQTLGRKTEETPLSIERGFGRSNGPSPLIIEEQPTTPKMHEAWMFDGAVGEVTGDMLEKNSAAVEEDPRKRKGHHFRRRVE
ncbi:hypothetical protein F2Q69_00011692 [Brassica cretica]|uniref:Uncharacterized protein n=1 Tax=Brassica cretica TaxID=69181 RepID=A0A8S9R703_BRACR|nr:hypothetical protein F2Q69_00011692 [Brassica cretica]